MSTIFQRLVWLDVMKSLSAFMVCFYHLTENNRVVDFGHFEDGVYFMSIEKFLYGILSVSVPLFFIASGTTIHLKDRTIKENLAKVLQLVVIYFFWGGFCNFLIVGFKTGELSITINSFLHSPFYLWYLPTLASIYLFYIIWQRIKGNSWSVLLIYFFLLIPFSSNLVGDLLVSYNKDYASSFFLHSGFFRFYTIVFTLIPSIWKCEVSTISAFVMVIIGLILIGYEVSVYSDATQEIYNGVNSSFPTWGALLMSLGIYSLMKRIPNSYNLSFFRWISSNCLGIYIFHYPLIVVLVKYCSVLNYGWILNLYLHL